MQHSAAFFWFRLPKFTLTQAQVALQETGLEAEISADGFLMVPYSFGGEGPPFCISLEQGPEVTDLINQVAPSTSYAAQLANCEQQLTVYIEDLEAALDETNTLIEIQLTLQEATNGYLYLAWNGSISPPEPTSSQA